MIVLCLCCLSGVINNNNNLTLLWRCIVLVHPVRRAYLSGKERSKNGEEAADAEIRQREANNCQLFDATHRQKTRQAAGGTRLGTFYDDIICNVRVLRVRTRPQPVLSTYRQIGACTRYADPSCHLCSGHASSPLVNSPAYKPLSAEVLLVISSLPGHRVYTIITSDKLYLPRN